MAWYHRLLNVVRPARLSRDLDREIDFHLAERADELVARGLSQPAAVQEAHRRFGNRTAQRERAHDVNVATWLESVVADVRYAGRALRASPGFTIVTVLSLGLGIGANTAIFSLVDAVMLKSLPVSHPEGLVKIMRGETNDIFTNPIWEQLRDRRNLFSGVFAVADEEFNLATGGEARPVRGNWVSGEYFTTLGLRPTLGRLLGSADDVRGCPAVAVLSHGFWRSEYGGAPSVIGRSILLGGHAFEIVGVTDPAFFGVTVGRTSNVYAPLCAEAIVKGPASALDRSTWFLRIVGRPKDGMSLAQLRARLAAAAPSVYAATVPLDWAADERLEYLQRPLGAIKASTGLSRVRQQYRQALLTLTVVVAVVLLIACANVANLLLARATARQREIAIRLAIGAGRRRIVRQLLTESLLLSMLGAAAGLVFARWGSGVLVRLLSTSSNAVWLDLPLGGRVLAFTIAVASVIGLLFGVAPAWRSTGIGPQAASKPQGRGVIDGHSRFTVGRALVVGQIALSLALIVGAGLLLGTFRTLTTLNPGFESDGVLLVDVRLANARYPADRLFTVHRGILERLRATPGVRAVGASQIVPISGVGWSERVSVDGHAASSAEDDLVLLNEVSDGYFAALQTSLLSGRDFAPSDRPGSPPVVIVNESMARRFFAGTSPLGRQLRVQFGDTLGAPREIIGVVRDAKYRSLREESRPTAYLPLYQGSESATFVTLEVRTDVAAASLIPAVRSAMAEIDPRIGLQFTTLSDHVNASLLRERMLATLSGFFGGLALLLAVVGLYGTMAYSVARRRSEIGIRLALGAARAQVMRMVLGEVGRIVALGVALGALLAMATTRLLTSFLFGLAAWDPATLVFSALTLASVAVAAGAVPAWRAARLDPSDALREE